MTVASNILWIDIETVPLRSSEEEAKKDNPDLYDVWTRRYCTDKPEDVSVRDRYWQRASLVPEFAKIICIAVGREKEDMGIIRLHTKSFWWEEKHILQEFASMLNHTWFSWWRLGGHNIKGFDLSFIIKRMIIHEIQIPAILNIVGKKPWEITHVDTLELRQFWRQTHTSLELLCLSLGVQTSKEELSGEDIKDLYYSDQDRSKEEIITHYCEEDVTASYDCYKAIMNKL